MGRCAWSGAVWSKANVRSGESRFMPASMSRCIRRASRRVTLLVMQVSEREIAERLARWRRSGDPHDLWPGLEERDFRRALDEMGHATQLVLEGGGEGAPVYCSFSAPLRSLGVAAFSSGTGPLLGYWVETGRIAAAAEVARLLAEHLAQGRARAAILERGLARVLDALQDRGIEAAVLKGMHTAWGYFPDPGTRPCSDIDILVEPRDFAGACDALAGMGFRQGRAVAEPPRSEWIPPDAAEVPRSLEITHAKSPWAVDLHASLDRPMRIGRTAGLGSPLLMDAEVMEHGGRTIRVLPQPLLLAWLAFHASSHLETSPLVCYLELVLVMRRDFAGHPALWDEFLRLVDGASMGRFVYPALELAERLAPGTVPGEVRQALARSAPWLMRRVMARLRPEAAQQLYHVSLDLRLMWAASAREMVAYVTSLRRVRLLLGGRLSLRARH